MHPTKQNIQVFLLFNTMLSHIWKLFHPIIYLLQLSSVGSLFLHKLKVVKNRNKTQAISLFVDLLLGILFYFIVSNNLTPISDQSFTFVPSVDYIGIQVEHLIRWLMGIPIGLKLNSNLNQFLGKFFLHHVRLWLEYIHVLSAAFWDESQHKDLLEWLLLICCGGFSFVFAILSDLTAILSFHIYCFYVYATRVYGLQMHGIISLGRLFRGLKRNPLRQRIDSMTQQSERLFIGTLVFTALLFLLPTTMLYYVIFAALRLVIMAIQNNLLWLRKLFGNFPLYLVYRRVRFPEEFPGRAVFTQTQQGFIRLVVHPCPYMVVLHRWVTHTIQPTISFKQLLFSLVYGSLLKWV
uniref:Phosphatidylinositol N-acetylglucosaminyltransferase subunit Q-like n=2 Tax=Ciona intestinalis TaxID=7719 RepID=F6R1F8_CIOIN